MEGHARGACARGESVDGGAWPRWTPRERAGAVMAPRPAKLAADDASPAVNPAARSDRAVTAEEKIKFEQDKCIDGHGESWKAACSAWPSRFARISRTIRPG